MCNYSHQYSNTQFMQYASEMNYLRISVYRDGQPAYLNDPVVFDLNDLFEDPTTGIPVEKSPVSLQWYPNPATDHHFFNAGIGKPLRIEVFDITGKPVVRKESGPGNSSLDISALPRGFYTVRLAENAGVSTECFLKQ